MINTKNNEIIETIEIVGKIVLYEICNKVESNKDHFLKNSLAKSISLLKSINLLSEAESYNDGWTLFRTLVDRLAHIYHLNETDSYEQFFAWSHIRQVDYQNSAKSDKRFEEKTNNQLFKIDTDNRKKYQNYKSLNIKWSRPNVEKVLKGKGFDFLYKFGYDYSSAHVHPMANDGLYEFHLLTKLEPNPFNLFDQTNLMRNSLNVVILIFREILKSLSINFHHYFYQYLESVLDTFDNDHFTYKILCQKICEMKFNNLQLIEVSVK